MRLSQKRMSFEKLSKLDTIAEFGRTIDTELGYLLVSPFPDYSVFVESLAIFPNHEDVLNAVQPLLPLGTNDWYLALVDAVMEITAEEEMDMDYITGMRVSMIRAVQGIAVPTVDSVKHAIMQAIK